MMKDYMDNVRDLRENVANQFEQADRQNFTKEYLNRLRLGRGITNPMEGAGDEYGNYKKFEQGRNQVKEVNDKGYDDRGFDKFYSNLNKMMLEMKTPER